MRSLLAAALLVLVAGWAGAQTPPPLLLNPSGTLQFTSPDHDKATSYRVGWFRSETDTEPAVSETIPVSEVAVSVSGPGYSLSAKTRPPFARYILRLKMLATACDPGYCESPWSEPAQWTQSASSGTWAGYVPMRTMGVVLK